MVDDADEVEERETDWQVEQLDLMKALRERLNRVVIKTLAEFLVKHPKDFGFFSLITVRMLLNEVGMLVAAMANDAVTTETGELRSRALLEGLSLMERSEIGEHAAAVRKTLVSNLPSVLAAAQKKNPKAPMGELSLDVMQGLWDAVTGEEI